MREFASRILGLVDLDALEAFDARQLAGLFEEVSGIPSRGFASAEEGRQRIAELFRPAPRVKRAQSRITLPCRRPPTDPRPGRTDARLVKLLEEGTTFDEVAAKFVWDGETVRRKLKVLHLLYGFGIEELADGRLRLLDTPGRKEDPANVQ
jgi:hypothetical protein